MQDVFIFLYNSIMHITFLGTGSIIPTPKGGKSYSRSYSAILVEIKNETLLFDIGPGTLTKMQNIGIHTQKHPDNLFITHYHIDHCQDYVGLAMSRCFNTDTGKVGRGNILPVYGPPKLMEMSEQLFGTVERWKFMKYDLKVFDMLQIHETYEGLVKEAENWKVTCMPVKHYDGVAYRLEAEGTSFVYSGDMGYDENLAHLGKDADIVAVECSFPKKDMLNGLHLCPEDVAQLAKLGNFKKTILTHLYPQCEGKEEEMKIYIEKNSSTNVLIAHDFMRIEV